MNPITEETQFSKRVKHSCFICDYDENTDNLMYITYREKQLCICADCFNTAADILKILQAKAEAEKYKKIRMGGQ